MYRRNGPAVARLARANLSAAAADDATAETFTRAWASLGRYRDTGAPFVAWLYGIARHVIADAHRAGSRQYPTETMALPPTPDPTERRADYLDLYAAMGRLKRRQRRVVELKYLAGLDNDAIGAALGISPGAVNTLQWRALRNLERWLEAT